MKRILWTTAWACLLLGGCTQSQSQSKLDAMNRWDTARNRIHFRLAKDAYDKEQWSTCRDQLGKVLSSDVLFVPAELLAAKLAMREGRYDEAHQYLERAAKADPNLAEVWYGKAMLAEQGGDLDSALHDAQKAMELDPSTPEYLLCVAELEVRSGQSDRALATLEAVSQRYSTHAGVQSALADLYGLKNDYAASARCLRRIVMTNPEDTDVRQRLAVSLSRAGRHEEALPLLVALSEKKETSTPAVQVALGHSAMQFGRYQQAEAAYARLCKDQPNNVEWNFRLAECYAVQNDDKAALERLERIFPMSPNHGEARALAGYLYYAHGDLAKAEENLRTAIDYVENPTLVALVLTRTLRAVGKDKEADECWAEFGDAVVAADQGGDSAEAAAVKASAWTLTGRQPRETLKR